MRALFLNTTGLIHAHFDEVSALFEDVVAEAARGEFTVEDIRALALAGGAVVGIGYNEANRPVLAMAFEFVYYPRLTAVNVLAIAGQGMRETQEELWPVFMDWCKQAGAEVIEASCSAAMARMLCRFGFDSTYRVVRRTL